MKITFNSSDGLGDFVLRSPVITALQAAGHEIQLLMRPPGCDLAEVLFPEVHIHRLVADPYETERRLAARPFRADFAAVKAFGPDVYVAGLFQMNFLDELFLLQQPVRAKSVGFVSTDEAWFTATNTAPQELAKRLGDAVEVASELPELAKNHLLAGKLGCPLPVGTLPRLHAPEAARSEAAVLLRSLGLEGGGYLVVCAGGRKGLHAKDWGEANWIPALTAIAQDSGQPLLFLGNAAEHFSIERIRAGLPASVRSVNLANPAPSIAVTHALIAASSGYVGRDSGLMHLAAATGRKILALYGGGHWGRFLPSSGPAVVVTHAMPCRGCDWHCPMDRPHCIRDIPHDSVLRGWHRLQEAGFSGVEVLEEACPPALTAIVAGKAARRLAMVSSWERRDRLNEQRTRNGPDRLARSFRHLMNRFFP